VPLPKLRLDITNPDQVREVISRLAPSVVINCAAWTAVDAAEENPAACFRANAEAVAWLTQACEANGCRLVQVSTDYVFGAEHNRRTPYQEDDAVGPLNTYGASKAAGEEAARRYARHLVVRVCGLFSADEHGPARGRNFLDTMLVLSRTHKEVNVVADQVCTPTFVPYAAAGILSLLALDEVGTFHVVSEGATSWHGCAAELFRQAGVTTVARPISSVEYASPVARPLYSVLASEKFEKATKSRLPDWRQGVADYVRQTMERIPCSLSS